MATANSSTRSASPPTYNRTSFAERRLPSSLDSRPPTASILSLLPLPKFLVNPCAAILARLVLEVSRLFGRPCHDELQGAPVSELTIQCSGLREHRRARPHPSSGELDQTEPREPFAALLRDSIASSREAYLPRVGGLSDRTPKTSGLDCRRVLRCTSPVARIESNAVGPNFIV
jgi:hypothetical protein